MAAVLPLERTAEDELLLDALLLLLRELFPELERTAELLLELLALDRTLLLLLRELLVPDERLLLEERLLEEEVERSCCTAEWLALERTEDPSLEERTEELLPEDRVLVEPEPVDRLLEEELEDRLLCWLDERLLLPEERVWATMFSPASMARASIREVAIFINFLMASQF